MDSDLGNLDTPTAKEKNLRDFEGHEVRFARVKLTSTSNLEIGDEELDLDSTYRFFVEGKVVGVNYAVDNDGALVRIQTIKVTDTQLIDWNDPDSWRG